MLVIFRSRLAGLVSGYDGYFADSFQFRDYRMVYIQDYTGGCLKIRGFISERFSGLRGRNDDCFQDLLTA